MHSQKITLTDGKEIEVSLLPLRAYGDLLVRLQSVFKEIVNEWDSVDNDQIIEKLPSFISEHLDEAGAIIEIGTRGQITAKEAIDERGLADAVEVITGLIAVNDVERIVASVKKAQAVFRKQKAQATSKTPPKQ